MVAIATWVQSTESRSSGQYSAGGARGEIGVARQLHRPSGAIDVERIPGDLAAQAGGQVPGSFTVTAFKRGDHGIQDPYILCPGKGCKHVWMFSRQLRRSLPRRIGYTRIRPGVAQGIESCRVATPGRQVGCGPAIPILRIHVHPGVVQGGDRACVAILGRQLERGAAFQIPRIHVRSGGAQGGDRACVATIDRTVERGAMRTHHIHVRLGGAQGGDRACVATLGRIVERGAALPILRIHVRFGDVQGVDRACVAIIGRMVERGHAIHILRIYVRSGGAQGGDRVHAAIPGRQVERDPVTRTRHIQALLAGEHGVDGCLDSCLVTTFMNGVEKFFHVPVLLCCVGRLTRGCRRA